MQNLQLGLKNVIVKKRIKIKSKKGREKEKYRKKREREKGREIELEKMGAEETRLTEKQFEF